MIEVFGKLLVPLDGTPEAAAALPAAHVLARSVQAEITLLAVVLARAGDPARHVADARAYLGRVAAELAATDSHRVSTAVRAGDVVTEILAEVDARRIDLVVMATHGRTGPVRAILGSVAEGILGRSRVPVALLRPGGHRLSQVKTMLVPVDGRPGAALALGAAVSLARAAGAKIVLTQVVPPMPPHLYESFPETTYAIYIDPAWIEEAHDSAEQYVQGLVRRLHQAGVSAEGETKAGPVASTIVETAARVNADLIVMSTHALTGPKRAVLGSVADDVVRTTDRPVLLVRQDAPVSRLGPSGADATTEAATSAPRGSNA